MGISKWIGGFLGFMKFRIETVPDPVSVGVIPVVPDIKSSSVLVRNIANVVATTENEDDNETNMMFTSNTVPGYEHREYVPGDALKRVNWKLSSKRSVLMVRLDEAAASVQPTVILDLYRPSGADADKAILDEEKLIVSVFGLLNALINHGIACTFIFRGDNEEMYSISVDNPDYPAQILLKVLAVKVAEGKRVDVSTAATGSCACILATTDAGDSFVPVAESFTESDNVNILGISVDMPNSTAFPMWYLGEDNNFKLV